MKHPIRWILIGLVSVPLLLVIVANGIAVSPSELPPPDPRMLITMPDGRQEALFEVLARSDLVEEVTGRHAKGGPVRQRTALADGPHRVEKPDVPEAMPWEDREMLPPDDGDIFGLAEYRLVKADHEQALALFRSLPKKHPRYARAQRRIGWDIYTKAMDDPARGLPFVNRSVLENPTEGNAWQDACRVYAVMLGFSAN